MYASGSVANTYLSFKAAIVGFIPKINGSVGLTIEVKPFEYQVGAYYKLFKCDFKKLFKWPPKFKKVCGMGDRHTLKISDGKLGNTYSQTIFAYNWP
jgi:hypothetical protein